MWRIFTIALCLGTGLFVSEAIQPALADHSPHPDVHSIRELPQVAGRPYEEVQAIVKRHRKVLRKKPGVTGVAVGAEGITVTIRTPEVRQTLPQTIEGVPVTVEVVPTLPPPPGVIVLRKGGVREPADSCPRHFTEIVRHDWRFCIDLNDPEPVPPMMAPPIAGIPFEEALAIFERHREKLLPRPGLGEGVSLGAEGIIVRTSKPAAAIPAEVEGLPVEVRPPMGPAEAMNHTVTQRTRPLRGGVAIGGSNLDGAVNIALSEGVAWMIFPTHIMSQGNICGSVAPCPPALSGQSPPLNHCSHQPLSPSVPIWQPPAPVMEQVGYPVRWEALRLWTLGPTVDATAAVMDDDFSEGNGSLSASRQQEKWTEIQGEDFTGLEESTPFVEQRVFVVTGNLPHVIPARIKELNLPANVVYDCLGGTIGSVVNQIFIKSDVIQFVPGDSGGTMLNEDGDILGLFNWRQSPAWIYGGGTPASIIREKLGFDRWYGTLSVNDNTFGVFNNGQWLLDNGDGQWTGTDGDQQYFFGRTGDRPVTGNWDFTAGNKLKIGVWRGSTHQWFLDKNGNGDWNGCSIDICAGPLGFPTDRPVPGDWDGDGKTEIGVWRPSTSQWFLDKNGNGQWDGCGIDLCWGPMAFATDKPVVGDWTGNGKSKIGTYRPSTGQWFLDSSGNGQWDGCGIDTCVGPFGLSDDLPVSGNWTGVGSSAKIGVFQPTSLFAPPGTWVLDNGNGTFESFEREQKLGPYGSAISLPFVWNKSIVKGN